MRMKLWKIFGESLDGVVDIPLSGEMLRLVAMLLLVGYKEQQLWFEHMDRVQALLYMDKVQQLWCGHKGVQ